MVNTNTCSCSHEQISDDEMFMSLCDIVSKKSHCISQHVASIAVRDGKILCSGINGTPPKQKNCCQAFADGEFTREEHHDYSMLNEIHSEISLMQYAAKEGISLKGSTIYCTLQPCKSCSLALSNVGIVRVVYGSKYHRTPPEATNVLLDAGIKIECLRE